MQRVLGSLLIFISLSSNAQTVDLQTQLNQCVQDKYQKLSMMGFVSSEITRIGASAIETILVNKSNYYANYITIVTNIMSIPPLPSSAKSEFERQQICASKYQQVDQVRKGFQNNMNIFIADRINLATRDLLALPPTSPSIVYHMINKLNAGVPMYRLNNLPFPTCR